MPASGSGHSDGVNGSLMLIAPPPIVGNGREQSSARGQAFSLLRKFFGENSELERERVLTNVECLRSCTSGSTPCMYDS